MATTSGGLNVPIGTYTPYTGDYGTYGEYGGEWNWFPSSTASTPPSPGSTPGVASPSSSDTGLGGGGGNQGNLGGTGGGGPGNSGRPGSGGNYGNNISGGIGGLALGGGSSDGSSYGGQSVLAPGGWANNLASSALNIGGMLPGPIGTALGVVGAGLDLANAAETNSQVVGLGGNPLSFGGYLGAILGANPLLSALGLGNQYASGVGALLNQTNSSLGSARSAYNNGMANPMAGATDLPGNPGIAQTMGGQLAFSGPSALNAMGGGGNGGLGNAGAITNAGGSAQANAAQVGRGSGFTGGNTGTDMAGGNAGGNQGGGGGNGMTGSGNAGARGGAEKIKRGGLVRSHSPGHQMKSGGRVRSYKEFLGK